MWKGWESYVPPGVISDTGRVSRQTATAAKGSKYRNRKTTVDGITFDSAKEARRWTELRMLQQAGEICGLRRQNEYALIVNGHHVASYRSDFDYVQVINDEAVSVVEDVKSAATRKLPVYRLKFKLMQACHGITIREV